MAMDCIQAGELIARSVSGNASPEVEAELKRHVLSCARCRETEARGRRGLGVLGYLPRVSPSLEKAALVPSQIARRSSRRLYWAAGLAAAAVVSIAAFALLRSPYQAAPPLPEGAHVAPPPSVEEPKREVAREELESMLDKDAPPQQPRVFEPEKQ